MKFEQTILFSNTSTMKKKGVTVFWVPSRTRFKVQGNKPIQSERCQAELGCWGWRGTGLFNAKHNWQLSLQGELGSVLLLARHVLEADMAEGCCLWGGRFETLRGDDDGTAAGALAGDGGCHGDGCHGSAPFRPKLFIEAEVQSKHRTRSWDPLSGAGRALRCQKETGYRHCYCSHCHHCCQRCRRWGRGNPGAPWGPLCCPVTTAKTSKR